MLGTDHIAVAEKTMERWRRTLVHWPGLHRIVMLGVVVYGRAVCVGQDRVCMHELTVALRVCAGDQAGPSPSMDGLGKGLMTPQA